jgi:hypothetical protein
LLHRGTGAGKWGHSVLPRDGRILFEAECVPNRDGIAKLSSNCTGHKPEGLFPALRQSGRYRPLRPAGSTRLPPGPP